MARRKKTETEARWPVETLPLMGPSKPPDPKEIARTPKVLVDRALLPAPLGTAESVMDELCLCVRDLSFSANSQGLGMALREWGYQNGRIHEGEMLAGALCDVSWSEDEEDSDELEIVLSPDEQIEIANSLGRLAWLSTLLNDDGLALVLDPLEGVFGSSHEFWEIPAKSVGEGNDDLATHWEIPKGVAQKHNDPSPQVLTWLCDNLSPRILYALINHGNDSADTWEGWNFAAQKVEQDEDGEWTEVERSTGYFLTSEGERAAVAWDGSKPGADADADVDCDDEEEGGAAVASPDYLYEHASSLRQVLTHAKDCQDNSEDCDDDADLSDPQLTEQLAILIDDLLSGRYGEHLQQVAQHPGLFRQLAQLREAW